MTDSALPSLPDEASAAAALRTALGQIEFARGYVLELLEATPRELWFTIPAGGSTSLAWQIGHLAVSQYGLLLFRQRGREPEDLELIPGRFRKRYARGSTPSDGEEDQPGADELLERLARIHTQSLAELRAADPARLLEPVDPPYALYPIKLGAVLFCPLHEQLHAGQIGLLRRQLGLAPVR
ncbi:DinB family protein [Candidatus Laterigemmans baculatus]|uniref:DinB family protein n=1 Tax=Candidatus Laterigemmans baculatus TaxID=2770505 RepID=UPI0013D98075|nr:DinB family protein [Candidatus Laterigemmans baculatus]